MMRSARRPFYPRLIKKRKMKNSHLEFAAAVISKLPEFSLEHFVDKNQLRFHRQGHHDFRDLMFNEGVVCLCCTAKREIHLPSELETNLTPVFCVNDVVAKINEGKFLLTPEWMTAAELTEHFTCFYDDTSIPRNTLSVPVVTDKEIAVCISGGFRTLCTSMIMFKRFFLDAYPNAKVFALTWRDERQNFSEDSVRFLRQLLGDNLVRLQFFHDDEAAVAEEQGRVEIWRNKASIGTNHKISFMTEMWYRRRYCNLMRKAYEQETGISFDLIYRTRFDVCPLDTPIHEPDKCVCSIDLCSFCPPEIADIETSLGVTFPDLSEEAFHAYGAMWEFGSEAHLVMTLEKNNIQYIQTHYVRMCRSWSGIEEPAKVKCKVLNTKIIF